MYLSFIFPLYYYLHFEFSSEKRAKWFAMNEKKGKMKKNEEANELEEGKMAYHGLTKYIFCI